MHAGQQITPKIQLVRPLGKGGMGSVWVAEHAGLGAQVAVKFMASRYAQSPEFVARFQQEAQAAAQLHDPHVVQLFEHGITDEGTPYVVMELLKGETLQSRLRRHGALPPLEVVRIVGHAAQALGRAHRLGLVHRDIKPENLFLVDAEGGPTLKVLDCGVAKRPPPAAIRPKGGARSAGLTGAGDALVPPLYTSPEQLISPKQVDHRADLWSLGVVVYQALTNRLPYAMGAGTLSVPAVEFTPPSALRPELPAAVDAWMTRALARDPAARFSSAGEMAASFERAITDTSGEDPAEAAESRPARSQRFEAAAPSSSGAQIGGARILIQKGHIAKVQAEAIVSPANPELSADFDGVSAAIHRAAGPELQEATRRLNGCRLGNAVITPGGQLRPPIRYVIHAAAPIYSVLREEECVSQLRSAYDASLEVAEKHRIRRVAFPALGTGANGFPPEKVAPIAIAAAAEHLATAGRAVELIVFVMLSDVSYTVFTRALAARPLT